MSTATNITMTPECANCDKEEGCDLEKCSACMAVEYCNVDCQKAHRPQHKRECKKRAAEIFDEALFKQPPPNEDCPICFLPLPLMSTGSKYKVCCGKKLCSGCIHAVNKMDDDAKCPFCRALAPTSDEDMIKRIKKRVEVDNAVAIYNLGYYYAEGRYGLQQDYTTALQLWHRAGELGFAKAYYTIGIAYWHGRGVERDKKKAIHYWELAAMKGDEHARHNLGVSEVKKGNYDRALKHYMIAVGGGYNKSLNEIKQLYKKGHATKDDYAKALRAYESYLDDIRSDQRDEAAAFSEAFKYYGSEMNQFIYIPRAGNHGTSGVRNLLRSGVPSCGCYLVAAIAMYVVTANANSSIV